MAGTPLYLLIHRANIYRRVYDDGAYGQQQWSYPTTPNQSSVRCRINTASVSLVYRHGREENIATHVVWFAPNTDVDETDEIEISGRRLKIVGIYPDSQNILLRVECSEDKVDTTSGGS